MSVLLPDPLGPMIATHSPRLTGKSISHSTWRSPKYLFRPRASIISGPPRPGGAPFVRAEAPLAPPCPFSPAIEALLIKQNMGLAARALTTVCACQAAHVGRIWVAVF